MKIALKFMALILALSSLLFAKPTHCTMRCDAQCIIMIKQDANFRNNLFSSMGAKKYEAFMDELSKHFNDAKNIAEDRYIDFKEMFAQECMTMYFEHNKQHLSTTNMLPNTDPWQLILFEKGKDAIFVKDMSKVKSEIDAYFTELSYGPNVHPFILDSKQNDKIGKVLNLKGLLRISWSFDLNFDKHLDLIFLPEKNPFINYAQIYDKNVPKIKCEDDGYTEFIDRCLIDIKPNFQANYALANQILAKSSLSKKQINELLNSRTGGVLVPVELEFEWFYTWVNYTGRELNYDTKNKAFSFVKHDNFLGFDPNYEDYLYAELRLILGFVKNYKILKNSDNLNFPNTFHAFKHWSSHDIIKISYDDLAKFPKQFFAFTHTNENDFIVNLRQKPDKNAPIVKTLASQFVRINLTEKKGVCHESDHSICIKNHTEDEVYDIIEAQRKRQDDFVKNKDFLDKKNYAILVQEILPNNWCKVLVLKLPDEYFKDLDDEAWDGKKSLFEKTDFFDFKDTIMPILNDKIAKDIDKFKLYEGYIHASGLELLGAL